MSEDTTDPMEREREFARAALNRRWKWAPTGGGTMPIVPHGNIVAYWLFWPGPRNPAGSLFRPWNTPETLAKVAPLGKSPSQCAPKIPPST